jgi:SLOG cluster2
VSEQDLPEVQSGLAVGVSVSRSEDLGRYGVTETHVRMALAEIARAVLVADGRLVYGGHLDEDGYTTFLVREIERFGRRNRPFTGYVPLSVHRALHTDTITDRIEDLSVLGIYVFLDANGNEVEPLDGRGAEPEPVEESVERQALTAAREVMAHNIDGRVALGGQRLDYRGRMPGVIEETIYAIRDSKPVFIAGGYGGAAADMAVALGIDEQNWLGVDAPRGPHIDELIEAVRASGWEVGGNGLTDDENRRLAITYRASEVASLVVKGLSRRRST